MEPKKSMKKEKSIADFDYKSITSFEDACVKTNIQVTIPDVSMIPEGLGRFIVAAYKLAIIFEAINNGWIPDWNNWNQYKYFSWFEVNATKALSSGFGFSGSDYDCTDARTVVGSRLCTDTSEKALYIGKHFEELYKDYLLISE